MKSIATSFAVFVCILSTGFSETDKDGFETRILVEASKSYSFPSPQLTMYQQYVVKHFEEEEMIDEEEDNNKYMLFIYEDSEGNKIKIESEISNKNEQITGKSILTLLGTKQFIEEQKKILKRIIKRNDEPKPKK